MRRTEGVILAVACVLFLIGCHTSRKASRVESVAVEHVETVRAESGTAATESAGTATGMATVEAARIDAGRVTIERDTAGLPVVISWHRALTDSATERRNESRHERRAAEAQTTIEEETTTASATADEMIATETEAPASRNSGLWKIVFFSLLAAVLWWKITK